MLKAIHAQEDKTAAREKADSVVKKLRGMKLDKIADKVEESIEKHRRNLDIHEPNEKQSYRPEVQYQSAQVRSRAKRVQALLTLPERTGIR